MISTIVFLGCLIASIVWLVRTRDKALTQPASTGGTQKGYTRPTFNISWLYKPVLLFLIGMFVSIYQPFVFERIDAGCVGLEVKLSGSERGVSDYRYQTGWVPYNEWISKVVELQTYQQHIEYEPQTITMKGGYTTTITPSFNYALIPEAAGDMYVNLRLSLKELEQTWLLQSVINAYPNGSKSVS